MSKAEDYYPIMAGEKRDLMIDKFKAQMKKWGIPVPKTEPIVINFSMYEFDKYGLIEYWIANEETEGYCGKFLFVFDGQTCPSHHHKLKHETFYVVKGRIRMNIDGAEQVLSAGDILAMPPGRKHSFTGIGPALLMEVSKPCREKDNIFDDERIGIV